MSGWRMVLAALGFVLAFGSLERAMAQVDTAVGVRPVGSDGRALNLDFEDGTLRDWTATGSAFARQPVRGDSVSRRRSDMRSQHQGEFWVGTFEIAGDEPQGTLTSSSFRVTQPWGSFWVAGGASAQTRVELLRADNKDVFFKVSGQESETLRPVVVDLRKLVGSDMVIRVVDLHGGPWGHINFDHFRLHASKPSWPHAVDPAERAADAPPPADVVPYAGLTAEEACIGTADRVLFG
jgi:hypothetical protein